ncbi:MAG: 5'-methylthioadenosine/adenosylhomocysteine nucleosidase [Firmicutes bacterium]|nr:5'-methylthioadenosine/adenosylhomocysteine nucleosidase [Bacillota bacterium]
MKKIGIVFAMNEELEALKQLLEIEKEYNIFELMVYEGKINNVEFVLIESGVGKVNAARSTQILIDNFKVDYIFNIGVAGGVSDKLEVGDIVLGNKLVQHDFDITAFDHEKGYIPKVGVYIDTDKYLFDLVKDVFNENNIKFHEGVIASGDIFCTEEKMGNKINTKFNALCVEMEGASIAQVCHLCKVPFIILRSISDVPNNNNQITYVEFLESSCNIIAKAMFEVLNKF